jgi:hypothetical protein
MPRSARGSQGSQRRTVDPPAGAPQRDHRFDAAVERRAIEHADEAGRPQQRERRGPVHTDRSRLRRQLATVSVRPSRYTVAIDAEVHPIEREIGIGQIHRVDRSM